MNKIRYERAHMVEEGVNRVTCPLCGKTIMKSPFVDCVKPCEGCGAMLAICAMKDFVAVWVCDKDEVFSNAERLEALSHKYAMIAKMLMQAC